MQTHLLVYKHKNVHYCSRFFDPKAGETIKKMPGVKEIFTLTGMDLTTLENEARKKAREAGITKVTNLMG